MNAVIDKVVMLLSTDWFDDYWPMLGLQANDFMRRQLRLQCREIVGQIMNGEDSYWEASFEDSRIEKTLSLFEESISFSNLVENDRKFLMQIAQESEENFLQSSGEELLDSLLSLLVSETDPEVFNDIPLEFAFKICSVYAETQNQEIDFVEISKNSGSAWDNQIKSYTADLPESLAYFASNLCESPTHISKFWICLRQCSSLAERKSLVEWFDRIAKELLGHSPAFPKWMIE